MKHTIGIIVLGALLIAGAQSQGTEFRRVKLPGQGERVTGMHCQRLKSCVISTDASGAGHLYASDGQNITGTLLEGNGKFAEPLGTLGDVRFAGFSKVGDRLIAHLIGAGGGFVSAKGDFTQPGSWTSVKIGSVQDGGTFGLNQQMGFGFKDDRWLHFTQSTIYESSDAPGAGALWTPVWSPISPSVPKNFADLRRADPSLCDSDPGLSWSPRLTQPAFVAADLSLILYPSGSRNQRGTVAPGVCISTDGGKRFHRVEFKLQGDVGPLGVTCTSSSHCFAYGGFDFEPKSAFIMVSNDVQQGKASTWAPAKLPALREDTKFRYIFFAPDGQNGWAVGWFGSNNPLLLSTSDGGSSWKDVSAMVRAVVPDMRLHSGYAVDATHVWLGGEKDTLLTMGY